ncbi:MAG: hypothetical protein JJV88_04005, partial [Sulfurovum sp.]|nr:hypothetical protein [Sulfurovaceae bacterium]
MLLNNDCEPVLRLFISIDIVGSTNYKVALTKEKNQVQPWLQFFSDFYKYFPLVLNKFTDINGKDFNIDKIRYLKIWKLLGDEIVFFIELVDYREAELYIVSLMDAIWDFKATYMPDNLSLKASSWIAGFPVNNSEFLIDKHIDFIGPSIDTGFRLSKFANDEKLIISVDLAILLLARNNERLYYFFDGYQILKGLFSNKKYPIISIDIRKTKPSSENEVMCYSKEKALKKLCKDFISEHNLYLSYPFIQNDDGNEFRGKPDDYDEKLQEINNLYKIIDYTSTTDVEIKKDSLEFSDRLKKELNYSTATVNVENNLMAMITIDENVFKYTIPYPSFTADSSNDSEVYTNKEIAIDEKIV